ncbi:MAG: Crp/Fnr family transcriptional regulator [Sphaerochaetaceae bacterium]|nr:Crp/Fnr family transcriptional regulator [Sphaerochaetaceae bacterium]
MKTVDSLKGLRFVESLTCERTQAMLATRECSMNAYTKGALVHIAKEPCESIDIVVEGELSVDHIDEEGNLTGIAYLHRDDIVGGNSIFAEVPSYPATISAATDVTLLSFKRQTLIRILEENHQALRVYLQLTSENSFMLSNKIMTTIGMTLRKRILIYLAKKAHFAADTLTPFGESKTRLALLLGSRRTSLSRELARMRFEGLIRYDAHDFVLSPRALEEAKARF